MFQKTLTVKYVITSKTCYCYLSERCYTLLEQGRVIEMLHKNNKFYLSCTQLMNMGDNELGLNATYARNLGIREDDSVIIRAVYNFPSVKLLTICTKSQDDYDIIGMLAQDIQSTLLDQVRVVYLNQTIVIWISNSLYVVATVENVQPSAPGRLDYLTEVLVLPPKMKKKKLKDEEVMATQEQTSNFLKYFRLSRSNNIVDKSKVVTDSLNMWRLNRFSALECIKNNKFKQAFHVFAFRESIPNNLKSKDSKSEIVIMAMDYIKPPKANNHFADDEICTKKIYVRLLIVEDFNEKTNGILSQKYDLFCSDEVFSYLSAKVGSKVTLEQQELQNNCIDEIEIYGKHSKDCAEKFKNLVSDHVRDLKYVLLNADVPIQIGFDTCTIKMNDKLYGLVDSNTIRNCNLKTTDGYVKYIEKEINASPRAYFTEFGNYDQIIRNCLDSLKKGYKDHRLENILITGRSGTGKTTLATVLADTVQVSLYYVHVESLNCKTLKGKSMESLTKVLHAAFENLIYYQPSLLIVDDLNAICERVVDSDAPTQESLLFNRASETLAEFIGSYTKDNVIAIVATCESITTLNANIFSSRGRHLFKDVLNIVDLNKNDRKLFLKHLFHAKKIADVDLDAIALETEGYVVQDLADFVDKAIFESYKESAPLNSTHCERALMKCSSSNLRDVRLHSPGDRTFDDVGGLDNVKNILVETFLWPARYSSLFAAAPLRLQTGLLLYGPPGTGKTLLAGAAAKQCGLRLISVKGPELLSKYIGASEQAVRDVFQRAQSAKPCILFFDEFDSLAPRRGHDSTGVTDRVVNQFLTQLDGVESLTGVCVLAATSRPDLLDPALLRPGRLDKQLVCSLPDLKSRVAILRALSRKMKLSRTVSLEKIAQSTDGYSGADLQSVLYTAQLSSVEKLLEEKKGATIEREEQVEIKQNDIDEAVKHTRPSLTKEEKLKYDRIYARFQGKPDASDLKNMKQRATLA